MHKDEIKKNIKELYSQAGKLACNGRDFSHILPKIEAEKEKLRQWTDTNYDTGESIPIGWEWIYTGGGFSHYQFAEGDCLFLVQSEETSKAPVKGERFSITLYVFSGEKPEEEENDGEESDGDEKDPYDYEMEMSILAKDKNGKPLKWNPKFFSLCEKTGKFLKTVFGEGGKDLGQDEIEKRVQEFIKNQ